MTTTERRTTKRETLSTARSAGKSRPIIVELESTFLRVRLKGSRNYYTVGYHQIFALGAENAAQEARRLKREAKKR